ncbi:hypothetical protein [Pedobacter panaciterrae]|uniref:hypothetical protein n=1 Tax=Pedobacter panaciterrae TaxID=363849 RepID=UPI00259ACE96|nr:hypothetical protein [uncultured Pedobacter sp.]
MKRLLIILLIFFATHPGNVAAQTWGEWFSQKKTQKKYLLEQVAALQAYIGFAKKGYEIAQKGLTTISNLKDGEFNLYNDFSGGLKRVNPAIKNYARVADIIALQVKIIQTYHKDYRQIKGLNHSGSDELDYIKRVYNRMLLDCEHAVDELITLTTASKLELTDDQRIQRIDRLYEDMLHRHDFTRSFGRDAVLLQQSRADEEKNTEQIKGWIQNPGN